jgi:hypothetical protein
VTRIRKKTLYLQFGIGTPEGHQKSILYTSKVKKKQSLQAQSKTIKKNSKHQINQLKQKKISNKSMLSTSKVNRNQKFV